MLFARRAGRAINPETGREEFVITLVAEDRSDVPELTAGDIWRRTPLVLLRKEEVVRVGPTSSAEDRYS